MHVKFIGVGEAFDPGLGNASYLIDFGTKLLVDCGYAVPKNLFLAINTPDEVDAVYITHFHADHTFGIPACLKRWHEEKRKKPLTIIGQPGVKEYLQKVIELGYPKTCDRLSYSLEFIETIDPLTFQGLSLAFGKTTHGMSNYAICITKGKVSVGISGDGGLTFATKQLFQPCQYLIHEAFGFEEAMAGHTTAIEIQQFAKTLPKLKTLAFVHLQRDERQKNLKRFENLNQNTPYEVIVPSPLDILTTLPTKS